MKRTIILLVLIASAFAMPSRANDPYPTGSVAFFGLTQCPAGWTLFDGAKGRTVVPMNGNTGTTVGTALANLEIPKHSHTESGTVTLTPTSMAAASGPNVNNGAAGTYRLQPDTGSGKTGNTSSETANIPYVQLLSCRKTAAPSDSQLPRGLITFSTSVGCASGWSMAAVTVGRYLVGLPADGRPLWTFGGPPLAAGESRTHTHTFQTQVTTSVGSLAIVSGCCLDNFVQHGTYPVSATADPAEAGLPYIHLTPCEVTR